MTSGAQARTTAERWRQVHDLTDRGTGLLGCSLLAAALGRLILPPRYASLLSSRRKASDVLTFAVFGTAVLGVALMLP